MQFSKWTPTAPYDLNQILQLVRRFTYTVTDVEQNGLYWRALGDRQTGLSLWCVRADLHAELIVQEGSPDLSVAHRQLARILAIDAEVSAFYRFAESDPHLWQIIGAFTAMRWLGTPTLFEALITVIIEQHISWVAAQKSQRALVEWANNTICYHDQRFYAFPTATQLAAASLTDLETIKITGKRKQLILDLARQVVDGSLDLEALREESPEAAYRLLTALKGVGHWTAAFVLARGMGVYQFVPYNDVALQAAANRYWNGVEGKLSPMETERIFRRYDPYAGEVAFYVYLRWIIEKYQQRDG
ncbi:MAG: hypothetical protein MUF87_20320 [Anaerolineae bacterium]|nr:hypothetical protein [Anaerolineae bacterium]